MATNRLYCPRCCRRVYSHDFFKETGHCIKCLRKSNSPYPSIKKFDKEVVSVAPFENGCGIVYKGEKGLIMIANRYDHGDIDAPPVRYMLGHGSYESFY